MDKKKRKPFDPWLIPPDAPSTPSTSGPAGPQTVSQVTEAIKQALARSLPQTLHVIGQISNFKRHSSGHLYFTLKDPYSELPCVMWRTDAAKLKFQVSDGLELVASGAIEVFERAGRYQLYVRRLEPRGVGSLELAFRQLYEKLEKEGLFAPQRKRPIPRFPRRIGIVTSPTGAALADMLRTLRNRYPCVHVLVFPSTVQGTDAAQDIARAIRLANRHAPGCGGIDVLIVGRGGGSLEDLWAFNEEAVARAVFTSAIPVISGVGHEVDTTICDLVADARAATPTAAAQLAVPVLDEVLQDLSRRQIRLHRGVVSRWNVAHLACRAILQRSTFRDPLVSLRHRSQTLDLLAHRLHRIYGARLAAASTQLHRLERIISQIAPGAVVGRLSLRLARTSHAIHEAVNKKIAGHSRAMESALRRLDRRSPQHLIPREMERVKFYQHRLVESQQRQLAAHRTRLKALTDLLLAVGHQRVLERGYSLTRGADGRLVRCVGDARPGDELTTVVCDGLIHSVVRDGNVSS